MEGSNADSSEQFIKVAVRVRPPDYSFDRHGTICAKTLPDQKNIVLESKSESRMYTFDHVADSESTQESIFRYAGKRIIDGCVEGYNGTIFAYGQTGSGKTFTMLGPSEETDLMRSQTRGLIPRCLEYLFSLMERKKNLHGDSIEFLCKCSFAELYQETAYDLLDSAMGTLQVRENIKRGIFLEGATETIVCSASEAFEVLRIGFANRTVAATAMNRESSRSHAVFILFLESKEKSNDVINIRASQLNLIDLAGSERQKDTNTSETRLREAGSINKSLSVLGNVMMALVNINQGKTRHVPYRDSKLTFLLRDSLGGNARTCIVANIHPNSKCFGETLSTLQFAQRAKQVKNCAIVNEDVCAKQEALQSEVLRLKEELRNYQEAVRVGELSALSCTADSERIDLVDAVRLLKTDQDIKEKLRAQLMSYKEAYERSEKNLLATKLVIKLRESKIETLEKAMKDSAGVLADSNEQSLLEEIRLLKLQLEHPTEVVRLRLISEKTTQEIRQLRRMPEILAFKELDDRTRAEFRNLVEKSRIFGEKGESPLTGPQLCTPASSVKVSAMKQNLNQALTPPRRSVAPKNSSRRRTIFTPGTGSIENIPPFYLDSPSTPRIPTFKPDLLQCAEVKEENDSADVLRIEDLVSEIKQLRSMNASLEQKTDGQQRLILKLETEHNSLKQVINEMDKKTQTAKKESEAREIELCSQIADITQQLESKIEEAQFSMSEAQDLKILLTSADKQLLEVKRSQQQKTTKKSDEFSSLQAKISQMQVQIEVIEKERNTLLEEKENLSNRVENLEAQLDFNSDILQDLEDRLLASEKEKNEAETKNLKLHSQNDENSLPFDELTFLRSENSLFVELKKSMGEEINQLKNSVKSEMSNLQAMKAQLLEKTSLCETLSSDLVEAKCQFEIASMSNETMRNELKVAVDDLDAERKKVDQLLSTLENERIAFQSKLNSSISDADSIRLNYETTKLQVFDLQAHITNLTEENENLKIVVSERSGKKSVQSVEYEEMLKDKEDELTILREKLTSLDMIVEDFKATLLLKNEEVQSLRKTNACLSSEMSKHSVIKLQNDQLIKERTVLQERLEKLKHESEQNAAFKTDEVKEMRRSYLNGEAQVIDLQRKLEVLETKFAKTEEIRKCMEVERERLIDSEQKLFVEKETFKSHASEQEEILAKKEKEIADLKRKLKTEEEENAVLAGHGNKKQRIHYVESLRADLSHLREAYDKLEKENVRITSQANLERRGSDKK